MTISVELTDLMTQSRVVNILNSIRKNSRVREELLQEILKANHALFANWTNHGLLFAYESAYEGDAYEVAHEDGAYFEPGSTSFTTNNVGGAELFGFVDIDVFDSLFYPDKYDDAGEYPILCFAFGKNVDFQFYFAEAAQTEIVSLGADYELAIVESTVPTKEWYRVTLTGKITSEVDPRVYFGGVISGKLATGNMP